jgi:hypothetical protein
LQIRLTVAGATLASRAAPLVLRGEQMTAMARSVPLRLRLEERGMRRAAAGVTVLPHSRDKFDCHADAL